MFVACVQANVVLQAFLAEDAAALNESKLLDSVWRAAEAYHFLILAHRQLYSSTNILY